MAHDWDPHFASIGEGVDPDWDAAADYIDRFTVDQLAELLENADLSPEIDEAAATHLPAARKILREDLDRFKQAVEIGHPQMVRFWTRDVFIYVVDDRGTSGLWESMAGLRWSGALVAAGFDDTR